MVAMITVYMVNMMRVHILEVYMYMMVALNYCERSYGGSGHGGASYEECSGSYKGYGGGTYGGSSEGYTVCCEGSYGCL